MDTRHAGRNIAMSNYQKGEKQPLLILRSIYGMKLYNQTSDLNECRFFLLQKQGWETYLYAPVDKNKSFS